jgi:hypothetical protein
MMFVPPPTLCYQQSWPTHWIRQSVRLIFDYRRPQCSRVSTIDQADRTSFRAADGGVE